jgi:hypothetical protein
VSPRIRWDDFEEMAKLRSSPQSLRFKIGDLILCSTVVRARVEASNPKTGEYRVTLQGTLDKESDSLEEESAQLNPKEREGPGGFSRR